MSEEYTFGNTGVTNTSIGTNTLASITTGIDNTAFGTNALRYITDGDGNSGFGIDVITNVSGNPSFCSAFGTDALKNVTTGVSNSAFGYQALMNLSTGYNNCAFGNQAGIIIGTGYNNTLFGSNTALYSESDHDMVGIGSGDAAVGSEIFGWIEDTLIGYGNRGGGGNIKIGHVSDIDEYSFWTVTIGSKLGPGIPAIQQAMGKYGDIQIGYEILYDVTHDYYYAETSESIVVGHSAARNCEESFSDVIMGYEAYQNSSYGQLGVIIGARANQTPLLANPYSTNVTFVGYQAGLNSIYDNDNQDYKVFVGAFSGEATLEEGRMTVVGYEAMRYAKGDNNTAIGYRSLLGSATYNATDAAPGTAVGAGKLTSVTTITDGDIVDVDCAGATPAGLDGTYFLMSSVATDFYVWFNLDTVTVDPGPPGLNLPALVGKTGIEVSIATGYTSTQIAAAIGTAMNNRLQNDFNATFNSGFDLGIFNVICTVNGDTTDINPGTATGSLKLLSVLKISDGTLVAPEISQIDVAGAIAEGLSQQYFLISSTTTDYYVWFNRNYYDVDPGPGGLNLPALVGKTGVEVNVSDSHSLTDFFSSIATPISNALIGTGEFITTTPSNYVRIVAARASVENTAIGNNVLSGVTVASNNIAFGSNAGTTLEDGYLNSILGSGADVGANTIKSNVVGSGANCLADSSTVLGANATASAAATGGIAIGSGAAITTAGQYQIGAAAVSGTAQMKFGGQVVSDEAWIGGGASELAIDANGNIVKTTPVAFSGMTTDATATSIANWTIANNTVRRIQALITGRRTGGTAGAVNDSGVYRLEGAVKNNGGVISISAVKEVEQEDQAAWNVAIAQPGVPDGTVHIYVTGALNNNVSWEAKIKTFTV